MNQQEIAKKLRKMESQIKELQEWQIQQKKLQKADDELRDKAMKMIEHVEEIYNAFKTFAKLGKPLANAIRKFIKFVLWMAGIGTAIWAAIENLPNLFQK